MTGRRHEVYLGDAVYGYISDVNEIVLYTTDGVTISNTIVLDIAVERNLQEWLESLKGKRG